MPDPFQHFLDAQQPVYADVLAELRAGRKQSHWMWFIFPQLAGLGHSAMARRYALAGADEARTYLAHPAPGEAAFRTALDRYFSGQGDPLTLGRL